MKTIAVNKKTFQLLSDLKKQKRARSFDELVFNLVIKEKKMPKTMFGVLKKKARRFSTKERKRMWRDLERER